MSANKSSKVSPSKQLSIFEPQFNERIRRQFYNNVEMFNLVDLMSEFSGTESASQYWVDTKKRLAADGFQLSDKILQLKFKAKDGKYYKSDAADGETCLRIIQSIPSAKAEPVRLWLASLGYQHIVAANQKARDLEKLEALGYSRNESFDQLRERVAGQQVLEGLKDALSKVANGRMLYGSVFNAEYMAIFGENAKSLEVILNSKSVRDGLPALQLSSLRFAELGLTALIKQQSSMTTEQVIVNVNAIMMPIGQTLRLICDQLGIHHITGKPMLESGVIVKLPDQLFLLKGGDDD